MSIHSRKLGAARALAALLATFALSSCIQNTGIAAKAGYTLSKSQANCLAPDAASVKNIAQRFAASAVEVGGDFCLKPESYECYLRKFSPTLANGQSTTEEIAHVAELGGNTVYKLKTQTYSTREAASAPGVSAVALQPGGDYNRSEYVCHQTALKDGVNFLAVGEGESLDDALSSAYSKCTSLAPRLVSGK